MNSERNIFCDHFAPSEATREFVRRYFTLEVRDTGDGEGAFTIVPDGTHNIFIVKSGRFRTTGPEGRELPVAFVMGPHTRHVRLAPLNGPVSAFGIKLEPWGLHRLYQGPAHELADTFAEPGKLFGERWPAYAESIRSSSEVGSAIALAELALSSLRREKVNERYDEIVKFASTLIDSCGKASVRESEELVTLSERHAKRTFKNIVGINPKFIARAARFTSFLKTAGGGPYKKALEMLRDFNYYDQSHFGKEFRQLAGILPREYFSGKYTCFTM